MTHPVDPEVARAHADVVGLFRRSPGAVDEVCRAARERLGAMPVFDPYDSRTWNSYALITADIETLLGYLREAGIPSSEPVNFRSLLIRVLYYLYLSEKSQTGVLLAELVHSDWELRLGPSHTSTIDVTERLAACVHAQGESEGARKLFERVLELRSERFGDNAPDTLLAACNLGSCLNQLGEYRAAFGLNKRTAERCRQQLGKDHETTIATTENLAASLFGRGWYRTALSLYQDSHQRRRRVSGEDALATMDTEASIAITLDRLGRHKAAQAVNAGLLPRFERVAGKEYSGTRDTRMRLVSNLRTLGRHEEAEKVHGGIPKYGSRTPGAGQGAARQVFAWQRLNPRGEGESR
ncbi:tetratricopeptide repeat protein [Streptomyces sp. 4R-3d]|uniref:tetratricopeptide repeat protein n=1 Tax=Streptomyces sp. 4R-3d TaxID=2559605 RepID=UPI0010720F4A|nr:tetratricopeptide repeat protein [Streptomyces sp. 4R-3d]TFI25612.1 tetratricopeptide repeat protein [Streptomyces sp. 4R-3d]